MNDQPTYTISTKVRSCAIYESAKISNVPEQWFQITFEMKKMPEELKEMFSGRMQLLEDIGTTDPLITAKSKHRPYVDVRDHGLGDLRGVDALKQAHDIMSSRNCTLDRFIRGMIVDVTVQPFEYSTRTLGGRTGTALSFHGIALDAHTLYKRVCGN